MNFKNFIFCAFFYWLTYLRTSFRQAYIIRELLGYNLISSLISVASYRDVPFHQPQLLQCYHHGAAFVSLWSPILSSSLSLWSPILSSWPHKVTICGRHVMASVRDINIAEALLILCLAYYVMKWVRHCWNWGAMAFMYRDMGRAFHEYNLRILHNG